MSEFSYIDFDSLYFHVIINSISTLIYSVIAYTYHSHTLVWLHKYGDNLYFHVFTAFLYLYSVICITL